MKLIEIEVVGKKQGFGVFSPGAFSFSPRGDLEEGRTHKYIKREPITTKAGKKSYRYWYHVPNQGLVALDSLKLGSSFSFGEGETAGHFHVVRIVHNKVTMRHDETGRELTTDVETLRDLLNPLAQGKASSASPVPQEEASSSGSAAASLRGVVPPSSEKSKKVEVEKVVKQSPRRLAVDIEGLRRYRNRDCIQDLRKFPMLQKKPKTIIELSTEIDDDYTEAKKLFEALYLLDNQDISLFVAKTSFSPETSYSDAKISLRGHFRRTSETGATTEAGSFERQFLLNTNEMAVSIENSMLKLPIEMRGNSLSMQIYQRQEDFLKELTSEFSDAEKKVVSVKIHAALDVGRYYWMTQGFQYSSKAERELHLASLQEELGYLKDFFDKKESTLAIAPDTSLDDLLDAGLTSDAVDTVIKRIDALPPNCEPWDVLALDQDLPRFTVLRPSTDKKEPLRVDCGLIKFAALSGTSWHGKKMIHPEVVGGKAQDGFEYAERYRVDASRQAEEKGKPWTWLNLQGGAKKEIIPQGDVGDSARPSVSSTDDSTRPRVSSTGIRREVSAESREQARLAARQREAELGFASLQADATRTMPRVTRRGRMI